MVFVVAQSSLLVCKEVVTKRVLESLDKRKVCVDFHRSVRLEGNLVSPLVRARACYSGKDDRSKG